MTADAASVTASDDELQAWREVHAHLSKAVLVAQEAVAVAKTTRRYWLEEICANVTPEGKLVNTSSWKKSGKTTRKPAAKRKTAASGTKAKRPRKQPAASNEPPSISVPFLFPVHPPPAILPNDAAGMAALPPQMYADPNNGEDRPQMTPMQAAQSNYPPPVRDSCVFSRVSTLVLTCLCLQFFSLII